MFILVISKNSEKVTKHKKSNPILVDLRWLQLQLCRCSHVFGDEEVVEEMDDRPC
jgi:hypothetical protein